MRGIVILLTITATAMGLCGLVAVLWSRSAFFLAEAWRNELERAPEHRVNGILDRMAGLDEAAIPALALALSSSRECVAREAAKTLRRQLVRWHELAPEDSARRQRQLARALADAWPHFDFQARRAAAELVGQLVARVPAQGHVGDAEFLAACAEVLRAHALSGPDPVEDATRPSAATPASVDRPAAAMDLSNPLEIPGLAPVSDIPLKLAESGSPGRADGPAPLSPLARAANPVRESSATTTAAKPAAGNSGVSTSAASNAPRRLTPIRPARFDGSSREGTAEAGPKGALDLRQLARRLSDESPQQAEAAREEMQDRGFSAKEVDVARRLLHPDAAARKELARSLPEMVGVDAAPWLLELSRDPDAEVRLEAMTLLATTGDPALLEALRKLVAADPDERILRLSGPLSRFSSLREKTTR